MRSLTPLTVNGFTIELPIGLPEVLDTKVRDSYQTFLRESTNDVRRHLTCASTLLPPKMRGKTRLNVLHAFGGLGATAQILNQCAANLNHTFWERDPVCVQFLKERYNNVVPVDDSFKLFQEVDLSEFDVLLMDMSVGTIKTPGVKEMWGKIAEWMLGHKERFVWFTDTACHKIHLNWKTYEKDFEHAVTFPNAESYLDSYCCWMEDKYGMTVSAAMREAGEIYAIVEAHTGNNRFQAIPYV